MKTLNPLIFLLLLLMPFTGIAQQTGRDSFRTKSSAAQQQAIDTTTEEAGTVNEVVSALDGTDRLNKQIDAYNKAKFMKSQEFVLSVMLLAFGVLVFTAEIILFLKGRLDSTQVLKVLLITLIVFAVLFLITAGYSNEQISAAIGLLGTIAGYLLGKASPPPAAEAEEKKKA